MDRAWMYDLARIDPVYIENVHHFVEVIFCPCVDYDNKIAWSDSKVVKLHLIKRGFKKSYTIWIAHGEIDMHYLKWTEERLEMIILIIMMKVYLMESIMALMMMMMILIMKSYYVTSNHKC
jgi:hypothetical protein